MKATELRDAIHKRYIDALTEDDAVVTVLACDMSIILGYFIKYKKVGLIPSDLMTRIESSYITFNCSCAPANLKAMIETYAQLRVICTEMVAEIRKEETDATS